MRDSGVSESHRSLLWRKIPTFEGGLGVLNRSIVDACVVVASHIANSTYELIRAMML